MFHVLPRGWDADDWARLNKPVDRRLFPTSLESVLSLLLFLLPPVRFAVSVVPQELPNTVWRGIFVGAEGRQDAIKHPDTVKEASRVLTKTAPEPMS